MEPGIPTLRTPDALSRHLEDRLQGQDVLIVGICGVAGSGKTTLCGQIIAASSVNAVRLDCDRFSTHSHTERQALIAEARRSGIAEHMAFIENPMNWYSFDHILAALDDLKNKRIHTHDRAWNRETGELDGRYQVRIAEDGPALILCDCIYLLHPAVRTALDLVVLVEAPEEIVAERGLQRSKGDAARAAALESLRRTYSVPYFETFGSRADIGYQAETCPQLAKPPTLLRDMLGTVPSLPGITYIQGEQQGLPTP